MTSQTAEAVVMNELFLRYASRLRRMRKRQKVALQKSNALLKPIRDARVDLSKHQKLVEESLRSLDLAKADRIVDGFFEQPAVNYLSLYTLSLLDRQYKLELIVCEFVVCILDMENLVDELAVWSSEQSASIQAYASKLVERLEIEIRENRSACDDLFNEVESEPEGISEELVTPQVAKFREYRRHLRRDVTYSWRERSKTVSDNKVKAFLGC